VLLLRKYIILLFSYFDTVPKGELKANDKLTLEVTFSEEEVKMYDLKPIIKYEVFKPLADISTFKQVRNRGYFVEWGDDIDLSADTLYIEGVLKDDA
jgi:hypothetical protein